MFFKKTSIREKIMLKTCKRENPQTAQGGGFPGGNISLMLLYLPYFLQSMDFFGQDCYNGNNP